MLYNVYYITICMCIFLFAVVSLTLCLILKRNLSLFTNLSRSCDIRLSFQDRAYSACALIQNRHSGLLNLIESVASTCRRTARNANQSVQPKFLSRADSSGG